MNTFLAIQAMAEQRKGGKKALAKLLPLVLPKNKLALIGDDRMLAMMCKVINQAGFNWKVIENKWPQFEEAFYGFDVERLAFMPREDWEAYTKDTRVVRNWIKIKAVMHNTFMLQQLAQEHGSFASFIANWPATDQIGLMAYLKKHGSRLGGKSAQWFLRGIGKDSFVITNDVALTIQNAGYDININPTSKRDLLKVQNAFNTWNEQTGLPFSHLSKIAACSVGVNYDNTTI